MTLSSSRITPANTGEEGHASQRKEHTCTAQNCTGSSLLVPRLFRGHAASEAFLRQGVRLRASGAGFAVLGLRILGRGKLGP